MGLSGAGGGGLLLVARELVVEAGGRVRHRLWLVPPLPFAAKTPPLACAVPPLCLRA